MPADSPAPRKWLGIPYLVMVEVIGDSRQAMQPNRNQGFTHMPRRHTHTQFFGYIVLFLYNWEAPLE